MERIWGDAIKSARCEAVVWIEDPNDEANDRFGRGHGRTEGDDNNTLMNETILKV